MYIFDKWNLPPEIEINPVLTSKEMIKSTIITGEKTSKCCYQYKMLSPAKYELKLKYKSTSINKNIRIPDIDEVTVILATEFKLNLKIYDTRGNPIDYDEMIIKRGNIEIKEKEISWEL